MLDGVGANARFSSIVDMVVDADHNVYIAEYRAAGVVRRVAVQVHQQVVMLRQMPLNNATGMTDAERNLLKRWFEAGAPTR